MCFLSFCPQNFLYLMNFPGKVYFFLLYWNSLGGKTVFLEENLNSFIKTSRFCIFSNETTFQWCNDNNSQERVALTRVCENSFARIAIANVPKKHSLEDFFFFLLKLNKSGLIFWPTTAKSHSQGKKGVVTLHLVRLKAVETAFCTSKMTDVRKRKTISTRRYECVSKRRKILQVINYVGDTRVCVYVGGCENVKFLRGKYISPCSGNRWR